MKSAIKSAFSACPHCRARKYRRLDDGEGGLFGRGKDGLFFLVLVLWTFLPFVPALLFFWWKPNIQELASLKWDHPVIFGLMQIGLDFGAVSAWWIKFGIWILFAVTLMFSFDWWRYFAGCTACCTGSYSDTKPFPVFPAKQFTPKSIPSRIVVAILRIANLRQIPWVGFCSTITAYCFLSIFWVFSLYAIIYVIPFLGLFLASIFAFFMGVFRCKKEVHGVFSALVVACSLYLGAKVWSGFLAAPFVAWLAWDFYLDNRRTRFAGLSSTRRSRALRSTLLRVPLLLLVMIPGLTFKAGVDWVCFRALDAMETGTSQMNSIGLPTLKTEQYPWTSPLRWLGVPRYRVVQTDISLKTPQQHVFSAISLVRFLLGALELLVLAVLVIMGLRVLAGMFLRELIVNGLRLNSYLPIWSLNCFQGDPATIDASNASKALSIHATLSLDKLWGRSVFLKRQLSPSGGIPSTELPTPTMALVGRSIHGLLIMDRYNLSRQTIRLDSTDGHRFVRWELGENDIVCISFNRLVGWTETIKLGTTVCLQCGMLAQGKILVHPVKGPGSLIFDLHGEFGEHTPNESIVFQPDRMVGFRLDHGSGDAHPEFSMNATGGTLNAFLGNIALFASPGSQLLLDPKGKDQDSNRPIMALLRHSYSIWG